METVVIERNLMSKPTDSKQADKCEPLILCGMRQCGKAWPVSGIRQMLISECRLFQF